MSEPRASVGSVWVVMDPPEEEPKYDHYGRIAGVYATWDAMEAESPACAWDHVEDRLFICGVHCKRIAEEFWVFA